MTPPAMTPPGHQPAAAPGTDSGRRRTASAMHDDDGVATVFAAIGSIVLLAFTIVAVQIGAATLARHRAESAADLGALAGATAALQGSGAACAKAAEVVRSNGIRMDSCAMDGADVLVTAVAGVRVGPLHAEATGRARAGPIAQQAP